MPIEANSTLNISDHELRKIYHSIEDLCTEVARLRDRVNHLGPKAEAYDAMIKVLGLVPDMGTVMSRDILQDADNVLRVVKNMLCSGEVQHHGV